MAVNSHRTEEAPTLIWVTQLTSAELRFELTCVDPKFCVLTSTGHRHPREGSLHVLLLKTGRNRGMDWCNKHRWSRHRRLD